MRDKAKIKILPENAAALLDNPTFNDVVDELTRFYTIELASCPVGSTEANEAHARLKGVSAIKWRLHDIAATLNRGRKGR